MGWSHFATAPSWGMVVVEAFFEASGVCLSDLIEDAELLGAVCNLLVLMDVIVSSTSQLHCPLISHVKSTLVKHCLTRKNSPRVELYGLHGFPFTYFRSLVNQNRNTSNILSRASSASPIAMNVFGRSR